MSDLLRFLAWFILGTMIGSYLKNLSLHGHRWTLADELEFWLALFRGRK